MPTIGIDCRFGSALAGLGTYTRHLTTELTLRDEPWTWVLFVQSQREPWLAELPSRGNIRFREAPFTHYSFAEQTDLPNLIQDEECDVFFSPHFNVPFFCPVPFCCTVHDLILHHFPNESSLLKRLAYRFVIGSAIRNAHAVLAVSEATKSDVRRWYGRRAAEKTTVAHPGVSPEFRHQPKEAQDAIRAKYDLEKPFLLYVGNCKQHKNVPVLLDAFASARLPGIELAVVAGGIECARLARREGVRFLPLVPPEDLPALYSASFGAVTATLAEGFCLPLIEAMACRTPVLATNVGPIPEVCGDHAILKEPSVEALAEGMRMLVLDNAVRSADRLTAAERWARGYEWKRTAEKVEEVLKGLI